MLLAVIKLPVDFSSQTIWEKDEERQTEIKPRKRVWIMKDVQVSGTTFVVAIIKKKSHRFISKIHRKQKNH